MCVCVYVCVYVCVCINHAEIYVNKLVFFKIKLKVAIEVFQEA